MEIDNTRITGDFKSYFDEFEDSIEKSLNYHKDANNIESSKEFFKKVYSLFVLLESLNNSNYFIGPSAKILMVQYFEENNIKGFLRVISNLFKGNEDSIQLREGVRKSTFTPYFNELYSDSLILLNQYYLNNYRECNQRLRAILENLYRHLYYKDHKEEFLMVHDGANENHLNIDSKKLREYLPRLSYLKKLKKVDEKFNVISNLDEEERKKKKTLFKTYARLYKHTSEFVHASKETYMGKHQSNSNLVYNLVKAKSLTNTTEEIINLSIVFLICAHIELFSRFNHYEKSVVLMNFDKDTKQKLRKFLNI